MIKIGVTDDHKLIRKSISLLINSFDGMNVVLQAEHGRDLLEQLNKISVDVVLLDIQMPVMNGYETCKILNERYPDIKILVVSQIATTESMHKTLNNGVHGYFSKNSEPTQIEAAIRNIYNSGYYFEPELGTLLYNVLYRHNKNQEPTDPLSELTEREMLVVKLAAQRLTDSEIADKLSINIRTVQTYRNRIIDKTEARNFLNVILMALKYNYISIEDL